MRHFGVGIIVSMLACFALVGPAPASADAAVAVMPIQADGIDPMFAANSVSRSECSSKPSTKTARDPSTGKTIVTDVPDGSLEVRAVSANSSVARVVSGKPAVSGIARTQ